MPDTPTHVFARRLRQVRRAAKVTQGDLAQGLNELMGTRLDSTAITRIEKGQRVVRLDEAVYCARILQVPLDSLLRDVEEVDPRAERLRLDLAEATWALSGLEEQVERKRDEVEVTQQRVDAAQYELDGLEEQTARQRSAVESLVRQIADLERDVAGEG